MKQNKKNHLIKTIRRKRFYNMLELWESQKKLGWKTLSSGYTGYFYWRKIEK